MHRNLSSSSATLLAKTPMEMDPSETTVMKLSQKTKKKNSEKKREANMKGFRTEKDSLGDVKVPAHAYWGAQTQRACDNFPISGLRAYPVFIKAYAMIKKAAAQVQMELNLMDPKMGRAIIRAANEVIAGDHNDQFVVDVYQAGAGTSFNMNVNEVVANRAIEFLNGERGDYSIVHPNDHVNMGQSTNDTFPTAIRMATCLHLQPMYKAIEGLKKSFRNKGKQYAKYVKAGRTHLQDAAPVTLGQEFQAWADTLTDCLAGIHQAEESIRELGIGGSAVGTGLNTHPRYSAMMVTQLSKLARIPFRRSKNLHKSMQSQYPVAHVSSALRNTSLEMIRISNDLRLLSSGPTSGIGEIILPPVQPGSSIMPGKVNPVMTECWNMTLFDIWGRDQTIAGCVQAGQYELNVMMPMMAYALLHNIEILTNISRVVSQRCIDGIQADAKVCRDYALKTVSLATALNPLIGYENAAKVVKKAVATKKSIIDVAVEMGFVGKAEVTRVLEPLKMIQPGIAKKGSKSAAKTAKKSNKRPKKNTKPSKKAVKQKSSAKKGPKRRNKAKKKK